MDKVFYVLTTHGTDIYDNYRDFYLTQDDIGSAYFAPRFSDNVIRFEEDNLHEVLAKPYTNKYMIYNLFMGYDIRTEFIDHLFLGCRSVKTGSQENCNINSRIHLTDSTQQNRHGNLTWYRSGMVTGDDGHVLFSCN